MYVLMSCGMHAYHLVGRITHSDHEAELLNSGWEPKSESVHSGGSKDVRGAIGVSPRAN